MDVEARLYVVRRVDTGAYFKQVSSGYLKNWKPDDPRLKNWTPDIEKAKTYTLKGAMSVGSKVEYRDYDVEIVRLKIVVDEVIKKFTGGKKP